MPADFALSADEAAHTEKVHNHLASSIAAAGGWISFERYMDITLYSPGLGYYSAGACKFGSGGDFITAPEISSLFGACVARQCAEVLQTLDGGCVLEIGAGSGRLAVDVLTRLASLGQLPERYYILEVSADLRARQRALLCACVPQFDGKITWLDAPPQQDFDGIVLANEVLDALPVTRFRFTQERYEEFGVAIVDGRLIWQSRPADDVITKSCRRLAESSGAWDDGYIGEYCPRLAPWTAAVVRSLRRGVALWFDYGLPRAHYYLAERHQGTLMCHFRHRALDDPFLFPGLQDITAWVDFTALAEAAEVGHWTVQGFTPQAHFLAGLGIDAEMALMSQQDANRFARLAAQAKLLMLPGEMGERIKVMAWTRGVEVELSGFALLDMRHSL